MSVSTPGFYRFTPPQQYSELLIDGKPAYHDCADCNSFEVVMHGCLRGTDGKVSILETEDGRLFLAVFCDTCFNRRVRANIAGVAPNPQFAEVCR